MLTIANGEPCLSFVLKTSKAALSKGGLRKEEGGGRFYVQGSDG